MPACPKKFKDQLDKLTAEALNAAGGTSAQKKKVSNKLLTFIKSTPNPSCNKEDKKALGLIFMLSLPSF